jgi:hypothetical protein
MSNYIRIYVPGIIVLAYAIAHQLACAAEGSPPAKTFLILGTADFLFLSYALLPRSNNANSLFLPYTVLPLLSNTRRNISAVEYEFIKSSRLPVCASFIVYLVSMVLDNKSTSDRYANLTLLSCVLAGCLVALYKINRLGSSSAEPQELSLPLVPMGSDAAVANI